MVISIPSPLHDRLVAWAKWCREPLRGPDEVRCSSAESAWLPVSGAVWVGVEELLVAELRKGGGGSEHLAIEVEVRVMRLPERPRSALRLHYVVHRRMPLGQKLRMLGVGVEEYPRLVERAARMVDW